MAVGEGRVIVTPLGEVLGSVRRMNAPKYMVTKVWQDGEEGIFFYPLAVVPK